MSSLHFSSLIFLPLSVVNSLECKCSDEPPAPQDPEWLERNVVAGFRTWQLLFLTIGGVIVLVVFLCCLMKCRIPRTKQEIEKDNHRKQLTLIFRSYLNEVGMDNIAFKDALEKVKEIHEEKHQSHLESEKSSSSLSDLTATGSKSMLIDDDDKLDEEAVVEGTTRRSAFLTDFTPQLMERNLKRLIFSGFYSSFSLWILRT
ncbi:uncharacterized protein LOC143235491 [Tachypleus tridentatus]|uniref:uncharacterized protein LOC143235491 n=1 Tax=Tachypleus tridentatus TaxID=6853 RepID=UPI003FD40DB9